MDSFFILAALVATAVIAGVGIDHAEPILRARVIETQPPIQPLDPSRRIPVPNREPGFVSLPGVCQSAHGRRSFADGEQLEVDPAKASGRRRV
jgi:hypothetical protein